MKAHAASPGWMSPTAKFVLLTSLYFSQGLPYGFFSEVLPVVMREEQASLPQISMTSLLALPWILKFLWAPWVDRHALSQVGHRKSWLIVLQTIGICLFLLLALFGPERGYQLLLYAYLFANLIAATQDIATDGLAVHLLDTKERGLGNGLQVAGYRLGMVVGGGLILVLLEYIPRTYAYAAMALALALMTLPLIRFREPIQPRPAAHRPTFSLVTDFLAQPGMIGWLLMIGFYKFGDAMTSQMLKPYLVDAGWAKDAIGWFNTLTSAAGLVGALVGGWFVWVLGRYRAVFFCGCIQSLGVLGYVAICQSWLDPQWLTAVGVLEHVTGSMATVALFTSMMDVCKLETASTDYTVQASMVVLTTGVAKALSGFSAEAYGYQNNFLLSALLCIMGALLFGWVYRRQAGSKAAFSLRLETPAP